MFFFLEIWALEFRECKRIYNRFDNQQRHYGVEYLVAYLFHVLKNKGSFFLLVGNNFERLNLLIIKVSGATARWPFTDSAVPSSLLLFLLLFSHFFKFTFRSDY